MEAAQSRDENAQHQRGNWSDGAVGVSESERAAVLQLLTK